MKCKIHNAVMADNECVLCELDKLVEPARVQYFSQFDKATRKRLQWHIRCIRLLAESGQAEILEERRFTQGPVRLIL